MTETVVVSNGATILKSTGGSQSLTSFEDIKGTTISCTLVLRDVERTQRFTRL